MTQPVTHVEEALAFFADGYNCAQSVLAAFGPELGLSREACIKVARGFGAGIARQGETCGALTGGVMVIGLRSSNDTSPSPAVKEATYVTIAELIARFRRRHGSLMCRDLLGCDLKTAEGRARALDLGLFAERCPVFVRAAVEILEELA